MAIDKYLKADTEEVAKLLLAGHEVPIKHPYDQDYLEQLLQKENTSPEFYIIGDNDKIYISLHNREIDGSAPPQLLAPATQNNALYSPYLDKDVKITNFPKEYKSLLDDYNAIKDSCDMYSQDCLGMTQTISEFKIIQKQLLMLSIEENFEDLPPNDQRQIMNSLRFSKADIKETKSAYSRLARDQQEVFMESAANAFKKMSNGQDVSMRRRDQRFLKELSPEIFEEAFEKIKREAEQNQLNNSTSSTIENIATPDSIR